MNCLRLSEIPKPPVNKTGWPWTEESSQLPPLTEEGKPWPKISIVTPSYNQGQFIEETIRSVLLQGYPKLEYIIIDGGSTDNSIDIIKKYEQWITHWVSEPDNGQSEAINKGWSRSSGEILAWINSDDTYEINAFQKAGSFLSDKIDVDMIYGDCNMIDDHGQFKEKAPTIDFHMKPLVCNEWFIPQQSTFFRSSVIKEVGGVNENLHLTMDWELWLRIALKGYNIIYFPQTLASFRYYAEAKTSSQSEASGEEQLRILNDIFINPEYLPKINKFKNAAYWKTFQWIGYVYFKNEDREKALSYFMKSLKYNPSCLMDKYIIKRLVMYIIGRTRYLTYYNYLYNTAKKLLGRFS
jgi:glycosyltransferase involved in cell wall biosynthesis